jgi:hypothetical protein
MIGNIFYLREIAHSRAGDKGDTSNIGVIAYQPEFYPPIEDQITTEAVRAHFGDLVKGKGVRYLLPRFSAMNIVMEQSLGGGVTRSLSLDPHGKSYSALILTMPILLDASTAAALRKKGREPVEQRILLALEQSGRLSVHARNAIK